MQNPVLRRSEAVDRDTQEHYGMNESNQRTFTIRQDPKVIHTMIKSPRSGARIL